MRREKLGILLALTALLAASCGGSGAGTPTTGAAIVFGAAVSLTGAQSKEGGLTKQGYDLWLDWINQRGGIVVNGVKHPVQIKYEDDQSNPNLSATLVQKLITDEKSQFILGPYGSAATATDAIVAEKNGIPMVEANGAAQSIFSKGYKYTFGVLSPANKYLTGVLDMAATLSPKPTTIAMLTANDNFSVEVAKAVEDYAPSKGLQVVFSKQYPAAAPDVSGLVSQAKALMYIGSIYQDALDDSAPRGHGNGKDKHGDDPAPPGKAGGGSTHDSGHGHAHGGVGRAPAHHGALVAGGDDGDGLGHAFGADRVL